MGHRQRRLDAARRQFRGQGTLIERGQSVAWNETSAPPPLPLDGSAVHVDAGIEYRLDLPRSCLRRSGR